MMYDTEEKKHLPEKRKNIQSPVAIVVNDSPDQLRLESAVLEKGGWTVHAYSNPMEAIPAMARMEVPDIIVTDLHMPGIDGWRFCRLLRSPEWKRYNKVPILVVSNTYSGMDANDVTASLGANAFLAAPYKPSILREQANILLKGQAPDSSISVLISLGDSEKNRSLVECFNRRGFCCTTANSGKEAVEIWNKQNPDLAVMVAHLSEMRPTQIFKEMLSAGVNTILIVVLSEEDEEDPMDLMKEGAYGIVREPLDLEGLANLCVQAHRERSFIRIGDLLDRRADSIREMNVQLKCEIEDRKRAEESLRQSHQRLEGILKDLKTSQEEVIRQERLRAVGTMVTGIAHDFNNAMTKILGFSEILLIQPEDLQNQDKRKSYLKSIRDTAEEAAEVVSRLNHFYQYRQEDEVFELCSLQRIVEDAISFSRPKWKSEALGRGVDISIENEVQKTPLIQGNANELREVVANIIFNAVEAMNERGAIRFRTFIEDKHIYLDIHDTGIGMTESNCRSCCDPFFTSKGESRAGLGLSVAYGILQRHKGTIDIKSDIGKGTSVRIGFPLPSQQALERSPREVNKESLPLRILVVDDDPVLCQFLTDSLEIEGHQVESAPHGKAGLDMLKSADFDLVITDRAMPVMNGVEFAANVKRIYPKLPVIMLTGFGDLMKAKNDIPSGIDFLLRKPVKNKILKEAIEKVMRKDKDLGTHSEKVGNKRAQ